MEILDQQTCGSTYQPPGEFSTPYDSFPFPELALLEPEQIDYLVTEFRRCIPSLVLEGRAPFIHSELYIDTMPDTYQDLVSICSLYNQKTSYNSLICFRMLFVKLKKLITASKSFTRVEEWLLAVQTLTMYQIMRIFDDDVQQKEFAERDFELLEKWSSKLQQGCTGSWLLMESIRRTLMVSLMLQCLCRFMKSGYSTLVPMMAMLPVSENAARWEGREGQSGPLVPYEKFVDDWNQGRVMTVDTYEMLLLKACRNAITI